MAVTSAMPEAVVIQELCNLHERFLDAADKEAAEKVEREEKAAKQEQEAATKLEDTVNTGDRSVLQVSSICIHGDQCVLQVSCIRINLFFSLVASDAALSLFQQTALLEAVAHLTFGDQSVLQVSCI